MSDKAIIKVENITKTYRIWDNPSDRLKSLFYGELSRFFPKKIRLSLAEKARAYYRDFNALQNVSFEVNPGEAVGIIGRNGAGKSTLLQIISGTLTPTSGTVQVKGRITALLELGAGFNPEFTGRENVHLSCSILGLSRAETELKLQDIIDFAEVGEFIDEPVKTYSSGMMLRLAFAVNTGVDPEILIIDEALSVGDAPFSAKCFRRLRKMISNGVAVLFVSHDIGTVRSICSRALWIKDSHPEMWGDAKTVSKEYEKFCWQEQGVKIKEPSKDQNIVSAPHTEYPSASVLRSMDPNQVIENTPPASIEGKAVQLDSVLKGSLINEANVDGAETNPAIGQLVSLLNSHNFLLPVTDPTTQMGNGDVKLERLLTINKEGEPTQVFPYNGKITMCYRFKAHRAIDSEFIIGIRFRDTLGNHVYSVQNLENVQHLKLNAEEVVHATIEFRVPLSHGDYIVRTGIFGFQDGKAFVDGAYDFARSVVWDVREDALNLEILPNSPMLLAGPVHVHGQMILHL